MGSIDDVAIPNTKRPKVSKLDGIDPDAEGQLASGKTWRQRSTPRHRTPHHIKLVTSSSSPPSSSSITELLPFPNGEGLLSATDHYLNLWELNSSFGYNYRMKEIKSFYHHGIRGLVMIENNIIASLDENGLIHFFKISSSSSYLLSKLKTISTNLKDPLCMCGFDSSVVPTFLRSRLIVGGLPNNEENNMMMDDDINCCFAEIDSNNGKIVGVVPGSPTSMINVITSLPDGWLVSADSDGDLRLWSIVREEKGQSIRSCSVSILTPKRDDINALGYVSAEIRLISGHQGAGLMAWDLLSSGTRIRVLKSPEGGKSIICLIDCKNGCIAGADSKGQIGIWDLRSGGLIQVLVDGQAVYSLALLPCGVGVTPPLVSGGRSGIIRLWL